MATLYVRDSDIFTVDDTDYKFTKYPTMQGLSFYSRLSGDEDRSQLIQQMIIAGVEVNNKPVDAQLFDRHFAGKLAHLMRVWEKLVEYQYEDVFQESDSEE